LRVKVWGCRGSLAAPGPDTIRYGGNTSCVEVRTGDDELIILDMGTGGRPLGLSLAHRDVRKIHLLLTHLHLDHLEGLGFFGPLWDSGIEFHVWGPSSPTRSLRERITRYLSPPLFPVHLSDVPSRPVFHDATDEPFEIGNAIVTAAPISHSGPTVGYRIDENGRSLAYMPDHEPMRGLNLLDLDPEWISGHALAKDVDVLLHDAQYTEIEYPDRIGWGHSSVEHVVTYGSIAHVKRLVLFHHDPLHTDAELETNLLRARELWADNGGAPELAYEGMEIDLSTPGVRAGPVGSGVERA
jgi:phosphoribosyl 1,2-cyclic phosphodiesterase